MHTQIIDEKTRFHFNSDFSGDIIISVDIGNNHGQEIEIPFVHLEAIVAEKLRREKIEKIENASNGEILRDEV